jgi:hypothetical protein
MRAWGEAPAEAALALRPEQAAAERELAEAALELRPEPVVAERELAEAALELRPEPERELAGAGTLEAVEQPIARTPKPS